MDHACLDPASDLVIVLLYIIVATNGSDVTHSPVLNFGAVTALAAWQHYEVWLYRRHASGLLVHIMALLLMLCD